MSALRVYDSDFVDDERGADLHVKARELISAYCGNWDVAIEWKRFVLAGGVLTDPQARQILNMMLTTDPSLAPEVTALLSRHRPDYATSRQTTIRKPKLKLVEEPARPWQVPARARLKFNFIRPQYFNGVLHVVDHNRVDMRWTATWVGNRGQDRDYEHRDPHLYVEYMCGRGTIRLRCVEGQGNGTRVETFQTRAEAEAIGVRWCKGCLPWLPDEDVP